MYRSALVACSILKPCSAGAFAPLREQLRWNGGTGNDGRGGTARRLLVLLARRRGLCGLFFFGCLVEATSPLRRNNLRETASVRDRSRSEGAAHPLCSSFSGHRTGRKYGRGRTRVRKNYCSIITRIAAVEPLTTPFPSCHAKPNARARWRAPAPLLTVC